MIDNFIVYHYVKSFIITYVRIIIVIIIDLSMRGVIIFVQ